MHTIAFNKWLDNRRKVNNTVVNGIALQPVADNS